MVEIAVIVPTFNRVESLKKCLDGIHCQTFRDFEIIVVNDGSSDATKAFLDSLPPHECKVLHFETNKGGNHARNAGVEACRSEYVAFCDDDDVWHPEKLERQLHFMKHNDLDLSYTGVTVFNSRGKKVKYIFREPPFPENLHKSIMAINFVGATSNAMMKRSSLEAVHFFDTALPALQDYDLFIRFLRSGYRCRGLNESLTSYHILHIKNNISYNVKKIVEASDALKKKYENDLYLSLLKRRLHIILAVRCLRSRRFLKTFIVYFIKKMFRKN